MTTSSKAIVVRTVSRLATASGLAFSMPSIAQESQKLEISVFGKNLTNKYYFLQASNGQSQGFNTGTPGDARTFGV
jgi:iron complex outermembrane receptor protein